MSASNSTFHGNKNQSNYNREAKTHDKLGLNATLYLAYRDIPALLQEHLFNKHKKDSYRCLDFGCGAALSTECIAKMVSSSGHRIEIIGVDINAENIVLAKQRLPNAQFFQVKEDDSLTHLGEFDLIICNFVLVEMSSNKMANALKKIQSLLSEAGIAIVTNCASKAYKRDNKWYTFNNDFDENIPSKSNGSKLKFKEDQPIKLQVFASYGSTLSFTFFDFFHSGAAYRKAYSEAGLALLETHKPIGKNSDEIAWKTEKRYSPYKIHILSKSLKTQPQLNIKAKL